MSIARFRPLGSRRSLLALLASLTLSLAPRVAAADTTLRMVSDAGDYVGLGQTYFFSSAQGTFTNYAGTGLEINFNSPTEFWTLDLAAPGGRLMKPGRYLGAHRYPFQGPSEPGLSVYGDGRGCNVVTGEFTVRQITYGAGSSIAALWAVFEQHCEGLAPKLLGEIRINADTSIYVTSVSDLTVLRNAPVQFDVLAVDAAGRPITLFTDALPAGATFTDHHDGTGTFSWPSGASSVGDVVVVFRARDTAGKNANSSTSIHVFGPDLLRLDSEPGDFIGGGQHYLLTHADGAFSTRRLGDGVQVDFAGSGLDWTLQFVPPAGHALTPGAYAGARRYPFQAPTEPGLTIEGNGRGCNTLTGLFVIRQIATDASNNVTSLWATFEQHCEGGIPKLTGEIRINADTSLYMTSSSDLTVQVHTPVHFDVSAVDAGGRPIQLSVDSPPVGSTFVDHGDGTGTFDWPGGPATAGDLVLVFRAQDDVGRTALTSTTIHAFGADLLSIVSDPGDYIGGGQTYHFTHADGAFTLTDLQSRGAELRFNGSGQSWTLDMLPPFGRLLQPGIYLNATRYPFQAANDPGLSVTANSGGCNTLTGSFQIRSVTYDSHSEVSSLWATIEQHCEGIPPKLLAEIRFNVDTALYVGSVADAFTPPGQPISVEVSAHDTRGFGVTLTAAGVPAGATFADHGNGTGTLSWKNPAPAATVAAVAFTAHSTNGETATSITNIHVLNPTFLDMVSDPGDYIGQGATYHFTEANASFSGSGGSSNVSMYVTGAGHWFYLNFYAPLGQSLAPGVYPGAMRFSDVGVPGLDVFGDGRGCNQVTGTFTVRAIGSDLLGNLSNFWATFVEHCEGGAPALTGEIYYVTDQIVPVLASLVRSDVSNGSVTLRWLAESRRSQPARVYRRGEREPWSELATVLADGSGYVDYTDESVASGARYVYRIGWDANGSVTYGPETWVDVPRGVPLALALDPIQPNPASGSQLKLSFSLPEARAASVDLMDVAGRSALRREIAAMPAGRHLVTLDGLGGLRSGFYVVRLQAGGRAVTQRVMLVR